MTAVRFVEKPDGWTTINFAYDPELVSMVKELSPGVRKYDPPTKTWLVLDEHAPRLAEQMEATGHQLLGAEDPAVPPPRRATQGVAEFFGVDDEQSTFDARTAAADVIAALPGQHVHRVFRAMAQQLYPDAYPKGKR